MFSICFIENFNRILYTGQQYDRETEQYYLWARYYNPMIGRFTQEDTFRGDGLNLYAYCANNPVRYFDPSGHMAEANTCPKGSGEAEVTRQEAAEVGSKGGLDTFDAKTATTKQKGNFGEYKVDYNLVNNQSLEVCNERLFM